MYTFVVKYLIKGTKNAAESWVAVISESVGGSFGKLLIIGLWILDKSYKILPGCKLLG